MTTIYVASYITADDHEAIQDGDAREWSMIDAAMGMTCAAGVDRAKVLEKAKAMLVGELIDMEDLLAKTSDAEVMSYNAQRVAFLHTGLVYTDVVDVMGNKAIEVMAPGDDLIVAVIVIREFDAIE